VKWIIIDQISGISLRSFLAAQREQVVHVVGFALQVVVVVLLAVVVVVVPVAVDEVNFIDDVIAPILIIEVVAALVAVVPAVAVVVVLVALRRRLPDPVEVVVGVDVGDVGRRVLSDRVVVKVVEILLLLLIGNRSRCCQNLNFIINIYIKY